MYSCPPNILITVRNRCETETAETRRSNVSIRVEKTVIEYMLEPYGPSPITNYDHKPPEFITFDITTTTTLSHIFHILRNHRHLCHELSQDLASQIFDKATTLIDLDSNPFTIDVLLTITGSRMASVNRRAFFANVKAMRLVGNGVIGEKSGLEMELCSICLEDLFEVSEEVTRMPCSHVFHGDCIIRWLVRENSCPSCRQVLFEHDEESDCESDCEE